MAQVAQYWLSTGQIAGIYEANTDALVEAQIVPDDPIFGYYKVQTPINAMDMQHYEIVAGTVQAKAQLTIVADNPIFPAQGGAKCTVTVEPFVPCTLLANLVDAYPLTVQQPTVEMSPGEPKSVRITLQLMAGYWADPIIVTAI